MSRAPIVGLFHKMREQIVAANPALTVKAQEQVKMGRAYAAHFVDAVHPSRNLESHAVAKTDRHRLRTRERFLVAIQRPAK